MHPSRPFPVVGASAEIMGPEGWRTVTLQEVHEEGRTLVAAGRRFTLRRLTGEWTEEGRANWEGGARLRLLDR